MRQRERKPGLASKLTDTWRPQQRQTLIAERTNDSRLLMANEFDFTQNWSPSEAESFYKEWQKDEGLSQVGCGVKRPADDNDASTSSEVNNFFNISQVKHVNVKKV